MVLFILGVIAGVLFRPAFIEMKNIAVKLWKDNVPKD